MSDEHVFVTGPFIIIMGVVCCVVIIYPVWLNITSCQGQVLHECCMHECNALP